MFDPHEIGECRKEVGKSRVEYVMGQSYSCNRVRYEGPQTEKSQGPIRKCSGGPFRKARFSKQQGHPEISVAGHGAASTERPQHGQRTRVGVFQSCKR